MKVVLAGGSGALGRRLSADLARRGHDVVVLTRSAVASSGSGADTGACRQVEWDGRTVGPWRAELEGSAVVNLAGALVDRRPTARNVELLTSSRVEPTRALVGAMAGCSVAPPVLLQASTLAIYGDAGEQVLDESSPPAEGPAQMAGVARAWEKAAREAPAGRTVVLRTGIVLDRDTPALDRLLGLARWGLGGTVGSGRQWVSWIHIDDWLAIVAEALEPTGEPLRGIVHATGPHPVRNAELMAALREVVGRRWAPPTPALMVRAGAVLLRTDPALALTGRRAHPARLAEAGFEFAHPHLREALDDLVGARRSGSGPAGTCIARP